MRHASIPSCKHWADGPQEVLAQNAADFRTETVEQWLEFCASAKEKAPDTSHILTYSSKPLPYNPVYLVAKRLAAHGYGVGIARFTDTAYAIHHPEQKGLSTYLTPGHEAIRPYIESDLKDPVRRPHTATLNSVYEGRITLGAFKVDSRPYKRARANYASLAGNNAELAIQRTFMTAALTEDYAAGLSNSTAPTIDASLLMQRARGLYGILHAEVYAPTTMMSWVRSPFVRWT